MYSNTWKNFVLTFFFFFFFKECKYFVYHCVCICVLKCLASFFVVLTDGYKIKKRKTKKMQKERTQI